jgi:hypothetical protein
VSSHPSTRMGQQSVRSFAGALPGPGLVPSRPAPFPSLPLSMPCILTPRCPHLRFYRKRKRAKISIPLPAESP